MPQVLKDEVRGRIIKSALSVFAARGYGDATMAEIARVAGVSTGNVYRYYEGKEALFDEVISNDFVERLETLLRARVEALRGTEDVRTLGPEATYHLAAEDLLAFTIDERLRVVILLGRAKGSRREGFFDTTAQSLVDLAFAHFTALMPDLAPTPLLKWTVRRIYENLLQTNIAILATYDTPMQIREAVAQSTRYHLAGMGALFAK